MAIDLSSLFVSSNLINLIKCKKGQNESFITFEALSNIAKEEENSSQPLETETETWDMREMFDRYLESARDNHEERPIFIEVKLIFVVVVDKLFNNFLIRKLNSQIILALF